MPGRNIKMFRYSNTLENTQILSTFLMYDNDRKQQVVDTYICGDDHNGAADNGDGDADN